MHKIYSRPRIKIPKIMVQSGNRKQNPKLRKIVTISIVFSIAFITAKLILGAIVPIFDTLCKNRAKSIATIVSNEQATNVMKNHTYDELFTIEKDNDGNIKMIKSNVIPINEIISDVANKIQEDLDAKGREDIEIPFGSITGLKLLSGKGPAIKITITPIGEVETDLRSEFIAQGINQTLHRVYLQVKCIVNIVTPFDNISKEITNQVLIMENVILGNIPDNYYNFEGVDSENDSLKIME